MLIRRGVCLHLKKRKREEEERSEKENELWGARWHQRSAVCGRLPQKRNGEWIQLLEAITEASGKSKRGVRQIN